MHCHPLLGKSLEHILSYQVDYTIYTDGSASPGTRNGVAAAVVTMGSPIQTTIVSTIKIKGSPVLMKKKLLPWKLLYSGNENSVQTSFPICMDSQSLCEALIMQPLSHINASMHIIHFITHLHKMGTKTLQHLWQWPRRPSSRRSNHNLARYNPPHTTFMGVSGHQWIILWWSTFALPHQRNLPTSQDFDWSTADKKPQRWCSNRSTLLRILHIAEGSSSWDWSWNWFYVSIMSASRTHTTTLASWIPSGRCY